MNDLITKYFLGELTPIQKKDLFEHLKNDPEAKKEFANMQNAWALAGTSASNGDTTKALPYLQDFRKRRNKKTARIFLINLSKYAAVLLVGILIAVAITRAPKVTDKPASAYQQLTVPTGQRAQLTLADGTTVWVNARSTLVYPGMFTGETREVTLTGEAYFNVANDPAHPFIVKSGNFRTQVTGTQFNIFAYDGFYHVALVEGKVKVYEADAEEHAMVLGKQEKATWADGNFVKSLVDDSETFSWKEGIYSFDDAPFPAIIEKLQLYYDVQIKVENKALLTRKYTGKFRQRDGIDNVLKIIRNVYPFNYWKNDDGSIIYIK